MSIKHLYADERPSLLLDFANSKTLDPRITFTRNSTATYVDEMGIIRTAAANEARFDQDPVTGECLGLLLEEERTNKIIDSADFTTSNWFIGSNTTRTANQDTAPDGTTTADRIQLSAASSSFIYYQCAVTSGVTYTFSIYIKNYNNTASSFDLYYNPGTPTQLGKTDATNDWVRYTLTVTPSSSGTHQFGINNPPDDYAVDILAWGAQIEEGSFATSIIPTSGSTVTRNADEAEITGTNFSSWYNTNAVTIVSTQKDVSPAGANLYDIVWGFGTGGSNRIELRQRAGEFKRGFYINGTNIAIAPLLYTKPNHTDNYTVGVAMDANGADQAAEGTSLATTNFTNATMPTISTLYFQTGVAGQYFGRKHILRLAYYNTRLSKTTLEALTK